MNLKNILEKRPSEIAREILSDGSVEATQFREQFDKSVTIREEVCLLYNALYRAEQALNGGLSTFGHSLELIEPKSASKSAKYRERGNECYKKKLFGNAIDFYNKSLAFAPIETDQNHATAYAFANRSAVFFHLKKDEACMHDLQQAFDNGYPEAGRYKLFHRKAKCQLDLGNKQQGRSTLLKAQKALETSGLDSQGRQQWVKRIEGELSRLNGTKYSPRRESNSDAYSGLGGSLKGRLPANGYRFKSEAARLMLSETKGRYFQASRDIAVGEYIIYERSAVNVLSVKYYNSFCYNCLQLLVHPLPCTGCTKILFCSAQCRDIAMSTFHADECRILPRYNAFTDANRNELQTDLALRCLLTMTSADFDREESIGRVTSDPRDISIFTLLSHLDKTSLDKRLLFIITALHGAFAVKDSRFWRHILKHHDFQGGDPIVSFSVFLAYFLGAAVCNSIQVSCYELPDDHDFRHARLHYISSCLCPYVDMSNHSCNSAAEVQFYSTHCVIRAVRNIRAGEEVSIDYGPHYTEGSKSDRRRELLRKYLFTCDCEACVSNWPPVEAQDTEVARFACERCRAAIDSPADTSGALICPRCQAHHCMVAICEKLGASHAAYGKAMSKVGKTDDMECIVSALEEHITLMDRWIRLPWQDYARCQATLKQMYRCMGHHFYSKDKIWEIGEHE